MRYHHFAKDKRNELSILLKKGYSLRDIAEVLGKNPSSISRELKRNQRSNGQYDPDAAQHKARKRRKYSKYQGMKIAECFELETYIASRLAKAWTPEQIAGRLKSDNGDQAVISAKSIYKFLYSAPGQYLCRYLPSQRHRPRKRREKKSERELIPNRVFIDLRPKIINERKRFGDFEGDTLGRPKGESEVIVGALERKSRYLLACKAPRLKNAMDGFKFLLNPYHGVIKSLTLDNGVENVKYEKLNVPTYFCHPYSSWEKGGVENAFLRLRRFIPKKARPTDYTDQDIFAIINIMNNTPRKCLNWKTPQEVFNRHYQESITDLSSVALGGKM